MVKEQQKLIFSNKRIGEKINSERERERERNNVIKITYQLTFTFLI